MLFQGNTQFKFILFYLSGTNCETNIYECSTSKNDINKCHHGVCINQTGSFKCYCEPGYTGLFCDADVDECLSHPCKNDAICRNLVCFLWDQKCSINLSNNMDFRLTTMSAHVHWDMMAKIAAMKSMNAPVIPVLMGLHVST